jgi:predicted flap endonuclease-1-like 5' DNA nuclease
VSYSIQEIEGIGAAYAEKLATAEIKTTDDLLELCCDPKGRKGMSEKTGLSETLILKWANMADLMRVSGIGPEYAELLEASGVDTVKELRTRNVENLTSKMNEINEAKKLTRAAPTASIVEKWVELAKSIDPRMTY